MLVSPSPLISVSGASGQALSKDQQKFNRLIEQIAQRRQQLLAWEAALTRCAAIYAAKVHPLDRQIELLEQRAPFVLAEAHAMKGLSRSLRKQLDEVICAMIGQVAHALVTPELKALYKRHGGTDFDEDQAEEKAFMKDMFGELTGVDLDDVTDFESPEDLLAHAARKAREQQQSAGEDAPERAARKKSAKQMAKEEARASEEKSASQTVREVYRKLASTLHPDRETDAQERARKTDLMQRVNDAYAQGNLLQLLELQWELEQIDPAALGRLPAHKLKHYLHVLKEQLAQLDAQLREVEVRAMVQFRLDQQARPSPVTLPRILEQEAVRKAAVVRGMTEELELFRNPVMLKDFVTHFRRQAKKAMAESPF